MRGAIELRAVLRALLFPVVRAWQLYLFTVLAAAVTLANARGGGALVEGTAVVGAYYVSGLLAAALAIAYLRFPGSLMEYLVTLLGAREVAVVMLSCGVLAAAASAAAVAPLAAAARLAGFHADWLLVAAGPLASVAAAATVAAAQALAGGSPVASAALLIVAAPLALRWLGVRASANAVWLLLLLALGVGAVSAAALLAAPEERLRRRLQRLGLGAPV